MPAPDHVERIPLSPPVFQILLSLCEGPMHGYAILTDIQSRTNTSVQLAAGTLYAAVQRMSEAGMIGQCDAPEGEPSADARRRYYRITDKGLELARTEARRVQSLAKLAASRELLGDLGAEPAG